MADILVRDVVKTYRIGVGRGRVREMIPHPFDKGVARLFPEWWARDTFNAVDGISLEVPAASTLGIVGHNGAGKTTLLKLMSSVIAPDSGEVRVRGRIGALIDLFVGFSPELTGRENLYLFGAVYGLGRRAMDKRVDQILAFAEIEELADTPLKRYSAGMGARLAFSTITALDMEMMLIDEVLAVGDAAFQRKCVEWLEDFVQGGGSLVFVSHNLSLVRNMTEEVVWVEHGRTVEQGPTAEVLPRYVTSLAGREGDRSASGEWSMRRQAQSHGQHRWGVGGARLDEVHIEADEKGRCSFSITYDTMDLKEAVFAVAFMDAGGQRLGSARSEVVSLNEKAGAMRCTVNLPFRSGIYFPLVAILSTDGKIRDQWRLERAIIIEDHEGDFASDYGPIALPSVWS